jgi:RimJ/RimL family protein N-acetyltransferase
MLNRAYWGHGYATEAVLAILDFGFQKLGARRISAWCHAANLASGRVLAKAGLHLERRYQDIEPKSGQLTERLEYAVCLEQWQTCSSEVE